MCQPQCNINGFTNHFATSFTYSIAVTGDASFKDIYSLHYALLRTGGYIINGMCIYSKGHQALWLIINSSCIRAATALAAVLMEIVERWHGVS